jgi:membrane protease YdiL (CAAX protease family)
MPTTKKKIAVLLAAPVLMSGFVAGFYLHVLERSFYYFWLHDLFVWIVLPAGSLAALRRTVPLQYADLGLPSLRDGRSSQLLNRWLVLSSLAFLSYIIVLGIFGMLFPPHPDAFTYDSMLPEGNERKFLVIYLAVSAAVVEEVFYRGFLKWLIVEGNESPQRILTYVLGSSVLFGLNHWPHGIHLVLSTTYLGVVAALLYLRVRNLWYLIFAHTLVNLVASISSF